MDDFKEMYYHLAHEVEWAKRILEKAQQDCEEMYLAQGEEAAAPSAETAEDTAEEKDTASA